MSNIFTTISFIACTTFWIRSFWTIPVIIRSSIPPIPPSIIRQCINFEKVIKKLQLFENSKKILKQSWAVVMDSLLTISWNWHQCNNLFHFNIICDFIFKTTSIMTTSAFIELKVFDQFSHKLCDKIDYDMKFPVIFISSSSMAMMWNLIFGYAHD